MFWRVSAQFQSGCIKKKREHIQTVHWVTTKHFFFPLIKDNYFK